MTQPSTRQRSSNSKEPENKGEEMTTGITEKPEVNIDFPKIIGDMTFQTPAELNEWAANLKKQLKEVDPIIRATKPGRPVSQKKKISEMSASVLNEEMSEELRIAINKLDDSFMLRLTLENGVFGLPAVAPRAEGSGGNRGGRSMNVDGQDYPSAKNARDTLHPDMKDKSQNYDSVAKYLESEGHTVVKDK